MLLLLLVMPVALLLMVCMLERYEHLIEAPSRELDEAALASALAPLTPEVGPELAPEAA